MCLKYKSNSVVSHLIKRNLTISTAESCTGGMLSKSITAIPYSSKVFQLGMCTYSNEMKNKILKIPSFILDQYGAVSYQTAKYMALSIKNIANSDVGVSITGIAGPSGGTPQKPVGLVYISLCSNNKIYVDKLNMKSYSREQIRIKSTDKALQLILSLLTF